MAELEEEIRTLCVRLLDAQLGQASFDYVQDFGAQLPAYVIAALLGVPPSDRDPVRHHIDEMFHIEPGVGMANDVAMTAGIWLAEYMDSQLNERRTRPGDDMLTDLVQAEITDQAGNTRRLTPEESTEFALLIIGAGTETVARLLGWAGLLLADHPDQLADLANDPRLIPNAVEELLRYESPSPVQGRWLTEEVQLHGQVIPIDSKVMLLTGSAGRDDRVYPEADRFDIRRTFKLHVAFGYGIHFCLGAALARMEGKVSAGGDLQALSRLDGGQSEGGASPHQYRPRLQRTPHATSDPRRVRAGIEVGLRLEDAALRPPSRGRMGQAVASAAILARSAPFPLRSMRPV